MKHLGRWQNFVVSDPEIRDGEPCVRGTDVPVRTILRELSSGSSIPDVLAAHPQLAPDQVLAVLGFAADQVHDRIRKRLRGATPPPAAPPDAR